MAGFSTGCGDRWLVCALQVPCPLAAAPTFKSPLPIRFLLGPGILPPSAPRSPAAPHQLSAPEGSGHVAGVAGVDRRAAAGVGAPLRLPARSQARGAQPRTWRGQGEGRWVDAAPQGGTVSPGSLLDPARWHVGPAASCQRRPPTQASRATWARRSGGGFPRRTTRAACAQRAWRGCPTRWTPSTGSARRRPRSRLAGWRWAGPGRAGASMVVLSQTIWRTLTPCL